MTATLTETRTRTEWGVRRTWPDGHVEVNRHDDRTGAEANARSVNWRNDAGELTETAEVVTRAVTVTDWQVAA